MELADPRRRAVGLKQTIRAVRGGKAERVFIAGDAGEEMVRELREEVLARGITLETIPTMKALGKACRIQVPAAAAASLRDEAEEGLYIPKG